MKLESGENVCQVWRRTVRLMVVTTVHIIHYCAQLSFLFLTIYPTRVRSLQPARASLRGEMCELSKHYIL